VSTFREIETQVDGEVVGKKFCVRCKGRLKEILANQSYGRGKRG
jgi:hypothetical protein